MTEPDPREILAIADSEIMEIISQCLGETGETAAYPPVVWTSEGTSNADES